MSDTLNKKNKILKCFLDDGFKVDTTKWSTQLSWKPDLRIKKKNAKIALIIRDSNNITDGWFQRVSLTRSKDIKFLIYFVLKNKPTQTTISDAKLYGVGLLVYNGRSSKTC